MRAAHLLVVSSLVLAWAAAGRAEPLPSGPHEATITLPEVLVRCGPSADVKYYPTSKLHHGDKIIVMQEEEGGWLAIKPPRGSFSWINTRFLETFDQNQAGRVLGDDVAVRIGSELVNTPPTVEAKTKLKRGGLVVILDPKPVYADDGSWLPIAPIPGEVRYVPADAVKSTPQVQHVQASPAAAMPQGPATSQSNASPTPVPTLTSAPPPAAAPAAPPGSDEALWEQAHQTELAGRSADATDLYYQLANKTTNHELQVRCYNRIHFLREGMRGSVPHNYQAGQPAEAHYPSQNTAIRIIPNYTSGQPQFAPQAQVTSQYNSTPAQPTYQPTYQQPAYQQPANLVQGSGPGWLRRAPFWLDQKVTYVLESSQGMPRMYVTAPGLNLEPFVGRNVDLQGTINYRGDVKTYYMNAIQVRPLQ